MKALLILLFIGWLGWLGGGSWFYVCQVKHLCGETELQSENPPVADPVELPDDEPDASELAGSALEPPVADTVPEKTAPPPPDVFYFHFDYGESEILPNPTVEANLDLLVDFLKENPDRKVAITGYTDAISSAEFNLALGMRRAHSLREMLSSRGIPGSQMMVDSKGEASPVASNKTKAGREENRRVKIELQ